MNEGTAVSGSGCTYLELDYFYWALESGSLCSQPWSLILTIDIVLFNNVPVHLKEERHIYEAQGLSVPQFIQAMNPNIINGRLNDECSLYY